MSAQRQRPTCCRQPTYVVFFLFVLAISFMSVVSATQSDDTTGDDWNYSLDIPCIPAHPVCPICMICDRDGKICVESDEIGWGCKCQNDMDCGGVADEHLQCGPLPKRCQCETGYKYNNTEAVCEETQCHGEWGCPCSSDGGDDLCTSMDPNSKCANRTLGTCECINGYHYSRNLSRCISDTGPCEVDPPCHTCFHCNQETDTCQPDWGCHCDDTSECSSSDSHMECGVTHKCQCEDGFQYDQLTRICVDSCPTLSAGAFVGIIGGVLLENVVLVLLTILIYRRHHALQTV